MDCVICLEKVYPQAVNAVLCINMHILHTPCFEKLSAQAEINTEFLPNGDQHDVLQVFCPLCKEKYPREVMTQNQILRFMENSGWTLPTCPHGCNRWQSRSHNRDFCEAISQRLTERAEHEITTHEGELRFSKMVSFLLLSLF